MRKHEQAPLKYLDQFCEWLGVNRRSMQFLMDHHRNPSFWTKTAPGNWDFNGWSAQHSKNASVDPMRTDLPDIFEANDYLEYNHDSKYITIGKGWP